MVDIHSVDNAPTFGFGISRAGHVTERFYLLMSFLRYIITTFTMSAPNQSVVVIPTGIAVIKAPEFN